MQTLSSESEALSIIDEYIANSGFVNLHAEYHSETRDGEGSTVRIVDFKLPVGKDQREAVINSVHRIYPETQEAIDFKGASSQFQEGADLYILVFMAEIHPIKQGDC